MLSGAIMDSSDHVPETAPRRLRKWFHPPHHPRACDRRRASVPRASQSAAATTRRRHRHSLGVVGVGVGAAATNRRDDQSKSERGAAKNKNMRQWGIYIGERREHGRLSSQNENSHCNFIPTHLLKIYALPLGQNSRHILPSFLLSLLSARTPE